MTVHDARRLMWEKGDARYNSPEEIGRYRDLSELEMFDMAESMRRNGVPEETVQAAFRAEREDRVRVRRTAEEVKREGADR